MISIEREHIWDGTRKAKQINIHCLIKFVLAFHVCFIFDTNTKLNIFLND